MIRTIIVFSVSYMLMACNGIVDPKPSLKLLHDTYYEADVNQRVVASISDLEEFSEYLSSNFELINPGIERLDSVKTFYLPTGMSLSQDEKVQNHIRLFFESHKEIKGFKLTFNSCVFGLEGVNVVGANWRLESRLFMNHTLTRPIISKYRRDTLLNAKHLYQIKVEEGVDLSQWWPEI